MRYRTLVCNRTPASKSSPDHNRNDDVELPVTGIADPDTFSPDAMVVDVLADAFETLPTTVVVGAAVVATGTVVEVVVEMVVDVLVEEVGADDRPSASRFHTKASAPPAEVRFATPALGSKSAVPLK